MRSIIKRYIPSILTKKDKQKQKKMIERSRKMYKKNKYITRKKLDSFKNTTSKHILKAREIYKTNKISANKELAKKTKCSLNSLKQIVKKGQGAYYSSGSRPNQTAHSWGNARLASSITGGKASAVDYDILLNGCHPNSKALSLAQKSKKQGTRRVAKYKGGFAFTIPMAVAGSMLLGGGKDDKMKETIVKLSRGPFPKKYTATLKDIKTNKTRILHFGDSRYEQYKDRTSLKLYANQNHGDKSRQANYYNRHSHEKNRKKAILKEKQKNNYYYTPKLLSHIYLW